MRKKVGMDDAMTAASARFDTLREAKQQTKSRGAPASAASVPDWSGARSPKPIGKKAAPKPRLVRCLPHVLLRIRHLTCSRQSACRQQAGHDCWRHRRANTCVAVAPHSCCKL